MIIHNKIFAVFFGLLAVAELAGYASGRSWCLYAAILAGILSVFLYRQVVKEKKYIKKYGRNRYGTL